MSIRNKEYIELLKHSFNEEKFIEFIIDLLNLDSSDLNRNIVENIITSKQFKDNILHYKHIANYNDGLNNIGVFVIKLNNTTTTKSRNMQRNFVATLLSKYNLDACLVSFYSERETSWRLSFVKRELSFTDKGIKENLTSAKRYSYLVGENESVHTAQEFLFKLLEIDNRKITLDDIEKQFDVEKVTKKFFEEYKEKYLELKEFFDKNKDFQTEAKNCDFDSVEFAKKLMGQIVFLYFLQKKGWLGVQLIPNELSIEEYNELSNTNDSVSQNLIRQYFVLNDDKYVVEKTKLRITEIQEDIINLTNVFINTKYNMPWGTGRKDFIRNIFNQAKIEHKNFFDDYLEYFFYKGLNEKRENQYFPLFNCKIPFLNGGLFEPLNNYRWSSAHFEIPNTIFSNDNKDGILDFLDLYNFTIDEEEPLEKDIAVDPEMLGKIFENLLDVNERASKGAFYTPREIVHYMCQESLANYLVNKVNVDYDEIIKFIKYGDVISQYDWEQSINESNEFEIGKTIYDNLLEIDEALFNVKVADPAVGSGAFPLGMLNEIVKLRLNIQTYILIKKELGIINIEDLYNTNHLESDVYKIKLQTIENCIYAVDIEPSAIDIAKLRLWLSLVVDYPNEKEPRPLPNLDCKIMQGNSLIDEFKGIPLFSPKLMNKSLNNSEKTGIQQNIFGLSETINIQQTLNFGDESNLDNYLDEITKLQKIFFATSDSKEKKRIKQKINDLQNGMVKESLRNDKIKLSEFEQICEKKQKPWFIWTLEFYEVFKENGGFDIVIGNPPYVDNSKIEDDEKNVYKNKYIVANSHYDLYIIFYNLAINILKQNGIVSFITSNKWLNQKYGLNLRKLILSNKLLKLVNFNDVKIFESATVDTEISFIQRTQAKLQINERFHDYDFDGCDFNNSMSVSNIPYQIISTKIIKMTNDYNFNLSISTEDCNILKKIYKDTIPFNNICYITLGAVIHCKESQNDKAEFLSDIKLNDYKNYIEGKDILRWKNKDCRLYLKYTPDKHREPRFPELFDGKKIICIRMSTKKNPHRFALNVGDYAADSVIIAKKYCEIPLSKIQLGNTKIEYQNVSYNYLIGLLNSKLLMYLFFNLYSDGLHFYPSHLKNMPIKIRFENELEKIVDNIYNNYDLSIDIADMEKELNNLVYKIYDLTNEEIRIIENYFEE